MPYNPDGTFTLTQDFGTGTPPSNDFPPQVGDVLNDVATSIDATNLFATVAASIATTVASLVIGSPTGGNKGSGTANAAGTIYQNNNAVFVQTQAASGGVIWSTFNHGTVSSGTIFPSAAVCAKQQVTNNGAFTISSASLGVGDVELLIINAASAGAITYSSFTKQFTGDTYSLTNGNAYVTFFYGLAGSRSAYVIKSLQ